MREIKIDQNLVEATHGTFLELESIKNLLGFAYSTTEYKIPEERIKMLEQQFSELSGKYSLLKNQIDNDYVKKEATENDDYWNLDFKTGIVTVYDKK